MAKLRPLDAERRRASGAGPDFSEALARGLQVITAFGSDSQQMTLSDVARAVDLPRATVRRALYTLERLGYVEANGRLFRLTAHVLRLASAYLAANAVSAVVQPICEAITRRTDEICGAGVLDGNEVAMIARALPAQLIPVGGGVGYRVPAHCSTLGRVLLAALPDAALDERLSRMGMTPPTRFSITDSAALRREILEIRRQGFSYADQEAEYGFRSLAVPLRRFDGAVVAALHIVARIERITEAEMLGPELGLLREAAATLRERLI
jgi:IclR family pca regulon transcriptional regulator